MKRVILKISTPASPEISRLTEIRVSAAPYKGFVSGFGHVRPYLFASSPCLVSVLPLSFFSRFFSSQILFLPPRALLSRIKSSLTLKLATRKLVELNSVSTGKQSPKQYVLHAQLEIDLLGGEFQSISYW